VRGLSGTDEKLLRKRVKASLDAHRRRAAADRQPLEYDLAALLDLVNGEDRCAYCDAWLTVTTFAPDHAMPTSRTANYTSGNVAVTCEPCNSAKGLLSAQEFLALLALVAGWHPWARADLLARLRAGGKRFAGR
jgi:hypothetical protein